MAGKFERLVEYAQQWRISDGHPFAADERDGFSVFEVAADSFALLVFRLFGEAQPCGFEEPMVEGAHGYARVLVPASWPASYPPSEARQLAAMLLRAADEAES